MQGLTIRAQAMMLLKRACDAGASSAALHVIHSSSARREGENAVDWMSAIEQLERLLLSLPAVARIDAGLGLDLQEEEHEDELAA